MIDRTLNGYRIFAAIQRTDGSWIIAGENAAKPCPYVTARWRDDMGDEWWQGHYLALRSEAFDDLVDRAREHAPEPTVSKIDERGSLNLLEDIAADGDGRFMVQLRDQPHRVEPLRSAREWFRVDGVELNGSQVATVRDWFEARL